MASDTIPASYQHNTSTGNECLPDDDDEEEEEEQLVLVELTGIIDSDILEKCDNKCKILGINTEKPVLQVDKYVFAGQYEDALGTCVIFEELPDQDGKVGDTICQKNESPAVVTQDTTCGDQLGHTYGQRGDGESTKPKLKYKCHTVKKLNMTRTFLTEKKEGEEGGGKIEWFQIKDDTSASWPQMICSFAQENEDAGESQSEEDDHGQLDVSNEETAQADQTFFSDGKQHSTDFEKGPSESEGILHLEPEEAESNINKLIPAAEQEAHSAEDAGSPRQDEIIHHDQKS